MRISDWSSDVCSSDLSEAERLVPLVEVVGHLAWDSLREPAFPFAEGLLPYDAAALVAATEAEDEARALRMARGAPFEGRAFRAIEEQPAAPATAPPTHFCTSRISVLNTGCHTHSPAPAIHSTPLL